MAKSNEFSCTLMGEVVITAANADWEPEDFSQLSKDKNLMKLVLGVLHGTHVIKVKEIPTLNFIVKVNRSIQPSYPDWVKRVIHPELGQSGSPEYDLRSIQLWYHENQKYKSATGHQIYLELDGKNALNDCLELADLLAIKAKGFEVFCSQFIGKEVCAWKSVVQRSDGSLHVPCLNVSYSKVALYWRCLDGYFKSGSPALRFNSNT
jgi:hypothetical protein